MARKSIISEIGDTVTGGGQSNLLASILPSLLAARLKEQRDKAERDLPASKYWQDFFNDPTLKASDVKTRLQGMSVTERTKANELAKSKQKYEEAKNPTIKQAQDKINELRAEFNKGHKRYLALSKKRGDRTPEEEAEFKALIATNKDTKTRLDNRMHVFGINFLKKSTPAQKDKYRSQLRKDTTKEFELWSGANPGKARILTSPHAMAMWKKLHMSKIAPELAPRISAGEMHRLWKYHPELLRQFQDVDRVRKWADNRGKSIDELLSREGGYKGGAYHGLWRTDKSGGWSPISEDRRNRNREVEPPTMSPETVMTPGAFDRASPETLMPEKFFRSGDPYGVNDWQENNMKTKPATQDKTQDGQRESWFKRWYDWHLPK
tara:strand:- start:125 stop:1261 length:1137 start_codon:yes stop_codon:yes gene_type:complete